ncbi:MAG: GyrI-like domain-containing protein [Lachnospiraceae bacterium]|nr:GyrI-like domain-containing protein [Lachnospiraceae bacterium]
MNPGIQCPVPEYCFVVYLDGEYKEENRRIEFCEMVDRYGTAPKGVESRKLEAITVVSVMHRGSYADLGLAYAFAAKWIQNNGYLITGNPRESFIDGIWNQDKEENWLTEVQIPVIKDKK